MLFKQQEFQVRGLDYSIRSANSSDADSLSQLRYQIDGETENLDREQGEAHLDAAAFEQLIKDDLENHHNLLLVAEAHGKIVGFSRCEGNSLKRKRHQVEFGVGVLEAFWGYGIGRQLLLESINWADASGSRKMTLQVLATNSKAITLYQNNGFEVEGRLKQDKLLSDGNYYDTVLMGRIQ